jgi:hypothetical protein
VIATVKTARIEFRIAFVLLIEFDSARGDPAADDSETARLTRASPPAQVATAHKIRRRPARRRYNVMRRAGARRKITRRDC